ncbi:hypothetical protein J3F83DRAFT_697214 [Trichoderma novae-zelandiae]
MTTCIVAMVAQQSASPPMYERPYLLECTKCIGTYRQHGALLMYKATSSRDALRCSRHTPRCGIFTSWHIQAPYLGHPHPPALWQPQPFLEVGTGFRSVPTVPRLRPSRSFACSGTFTHLTRSLFCQSSILAVYPSRRAQASRTKPKLGAVAFINPFRLFGALICHADSLSGPDSRPRVNRFAVILFCHPKIARLVLWLPSSRLQPPSDTARQNGGRRKAPRDPIVTAYEFHFGPVGFRTMLRYSLLAKEQVRPG